MLLQVLSLQIPNQFQYPLTVTTTTFVSPSLDYTTNFDTTNVDTANHKNNNPSFEFILLSIVTDRISTSDNDNNNDNDNANTPTDATSNIIYLTFNVTGASTSTYPTKTTNNMIYPTGESILPLIVTFPFMRRHEGGEGHEESEESSDLLPSFPDALNPELDNISFISQLLLQSTSSLFTLLFTQLLTQTPAPSADPPSMPPEQLLPVPSTFALPIISTTVPSSVPEGDYHHPTLSFSPEGDLLHASTISATFPTRVEGQVGSSRIHLFTIYIQTLCSLYPDDISPFFIQSLSVPSRERENQPLLVFKGSSRGIMTCLLLE